MRTITFKGRTAILDIKWDSSAQRFEVFVDNMLVFVGTTDQVRAWQIENGV